jgi:septal ring factor EnvC (AmiA/AmiB activator)
MLVALLLVLGAAVSPAQQESGIDERRRDLSELEERMQVMRQDLEARRDSRGVLLGELERREREIAQLALAGRELGQMIQEQTRVLTDVHGRLQGELRALEGERAALAGLLRSAYVLGGAERIRLLLDQEEVARVGRLLAYHEYLNRDRLHRIRAASERARALEVLRREVSEETQRLALLAARQEDTRRRLAEAQERRSDLLAELDRTIAGREEGLAELEADARALRALLEQLERQAMVLPEADLITQESIAGRRGRLPWPMEGGRLLERFGHLKGSGGLRWDGVLLSGPAGAEVRAVHHGRVVYADWLRGFGLLVIIEHDDGYMSLYGHNQTLLKEPGEWVAAGDPIALSGASGGNRSEALYFAIRHNGRPLDPEQWCASAGKSGAATRYFGPFLARAERPPDSPIQLGDWRSGQPRLGRRQEAPRSVGIPHRLQ